MFDGLTWNEFGGYYEGDSWAARGDAVEPFAQLVKTTDGRIPTERLSASDWHKLTQAFENAAEGWER